jgi:hypothetical protein
MLLSGTQGNAWSRVAYSTGHPPLHIPHVHPHTELPVIPPTSPPPTTTTVSTVPQAVSLPGQLQSIKRTVKHSRCPTSSSLGQRKAERQSNPANDCDNDWGCTRRPKRLKGFTTYELVSAFHIHPAYSGTVLLVQSLQQGHPREHTASAALLG